MSTECLELLKINPGETMLDTSWKAGRSAAGLLAARGEARPLTTISVLNPAEPNLAVVS
jgi:hypothetical protein